MKLNVLLYETYFKYTLRIYEPSPAIAYFAFGILTPTVAELSHIYRAAPVGGKER